MSIRFLPGASGEVRPRTDGETPQIWRACRRRRAHACPRDGGAQATGQFKLIGTPAKRLDTPSKVNGTAVYGIDARPPGVKIATLAQSPVFGGRVKNVDDAKAGGQGRAPDRAARRRRRGRGDHMGAAKKGLAALVIEWDDGRTPQLDTQKDRDTARKATLNPGRSRRTSACRQRNGERGHQGRATYRCRSCARDHGA